MTIFQAGGYFFNKNSWENISPRIIASCNQVMHLGVKSKQLSNPFWVLDYSLTEAGKVKAGNKTAAWQERPANIAHLYPPNTPYWENTSCDSEKVCSSYIIFIGGEHTGLSNYTDNSTRFARFSDPDKILAEMLLQSSEIGLKKKAESFFECQSIFFKIIGLLRKSIQLSENTFQIVENTAPKEKNLSERIDSFLEQNFHQKISLEKLAEHFKMSKSSLSHRYHQETGRTPIETLITIRIHNVRNKLLEDQRLKEIAESCGFYDEYHLSKTFKRLTGKSPRQFIAGRGL
jgi:AraC-like DNA-binding protein